MTSLERGLVVVSGAVVEVESMASSIPSWAEAAGKFSKADGPLFVVVLAAEVVVVVVVVSEVVVTGVVVVDVVVVVVEIVVVVLIVVVVGVEMVVVVVLDASSFLAASTRMEFSLLAKGRLPTFFFL